MFRQFRNSDVINMGGLNCPSEKRPVDPMQVKLCEIWINNYFTVRTTRYNEERDFRNYHSYYLKHAIENWAHGLYDYGILLKDDEGNVITNMQYVSNGAFIQALRNLGYKIEENKKGTGNVIPFAVYTGKYVGHTYDENKYIPHSEEEWTRVMFPFHEHIVYKRDEDPINLRFFKIKVNSSEGII